MKYLIIVIVLSGFFVHQTYSQDVYINGTIGLNVGAIQNPLQFNQQLLFYRPGSGIKLNAGAEYWTENNFVWGGQIGFNSTFLSRYYVDNGYSSTLSSYTFNWKSIEGSVLKFIALKDSRNFDGFSFGAGLGLAFPGTAKLTENNQYLGSAKYHINLGYQLLFNAYIEIHDLILVPGARINFLNFTLKDYNNPNSGSIDPRFYNQNAMGASFTMTFGRKIN